MSAETVTGGCLCGGIRYEVSAPLDDVAHCHCSMCRRASGAPLVTWFTVPPDTFRITCGNLKTWRSSPPAERGFCPDCGCQITFFHDAYPEGLDVTVATLDTPEAAQPTRHIWTESRIAWLHIDDALPHFPEETPPD